MPWPHLERRVAATVKRNLRQEIRIEVASSEGGRQLVQLRDWRRDQAGEWHAGRAALIVNRTSLRDLMKALQSVADQLGVEP